MIGVDKIGEIRRAYFEQGRSIKEIVRTLSTSRATVRKVIRGHKTEFKYARVVQPTPKLGDWVEALTEILEQESKLPKRERRSTQRLFEELRGPARCERLPKCGCRRGVRRGLPRRGWERPSGALRPWACGLG
jgi:hypothetical protein